MALTRVSDKRIAANRRNAQKSSGPRTAEGKARSSRNGCVHYAYARHHVMPEAWDRELCEQAKTITRATTDPVRRGYELDLVYHILWAIRLYDQETQLRSNCLKRFPGEPKRAAHLLVFDPCAQAFMRHLRRVEREVAAATRELQHYLTPQVRRKRRNRSAQVNAPTQRFNLMDLIEFLDKLCRPKPKRQQNKRAPEPLAASIVLPRSQPPRCVRTHPGPARHRTFIHRHFPPKRFTARSRIRDRPDPARTARAP